MSETRIRIVGGAYSGNNGPDVCLWDLFPGGHVEQVDSLRLGRSPSYMSVQGTTAFAALEEDGQAGMAVIDLSSGLEAKTMVTFPGSAACHILHYGNILILSSYLSGSVAGVSIDGDLLWNDYLPGGIRGQSHAHWATPGAVEGEVYIADLGADAIHRYLLDGQGKLVCRELAWQGPLGCGPRQMLATARPDLWVIVCELDSTVRVCLRQGDGTMTEIAMARSTDTAGSSAISGCVMDSDGFVFVPNRGPDTVSVFSVGAEGALTKENEINSGGQWPRMVSFAEDGAGRTYLLVAQQRSGGIEVFSRRGAELTWLGQTDLPQASFVGQVC